MPTFVVKSKSGSVPFKLDPSELEKAPYSLLAEAASLVTEQDIELDSWPNPNLAAFRVGLSNHCLRLVAARHQHTKHVGEWRLCNLCCAAAGSQGSHLSSCFAAPAAPQGLLCHTADENQWLCRWSWAA